MTVVSPVRWLPGENALARLGLGLARAVNNWLVVSQVTRTLGRLKVERPVLWLYNEPRAEHYRGRCGESLIVCDVFDRYSEFPHYKTEEWLGREVEERDHRIIASADLVFAASAELEKHCLRFNSNVKLVRNGADVEMAEFPAASRPWGATVPRPVLGYFGTVFSKLDLELLWDLMSEKKHWTLLLVGPLQEMPESDRRVWDRLIAMRNVFHVGTKSRMELPSYYAGIDVGLMPYRLTEHTRHISPLKMYEYLAFGKAVVSTDIPAAREMAGIVKIAGDGVGFALAVEAILGEQSPEAVAERVGVARSNSWSERVDRMSAEVEAAIVSKAKTKVSQA